MVTQIKTSRRRGRSSSSRTTLRVLLGLIILELLFALAGPWFALDEAKNQDLLIGARAPGAGHLLGTDDLGRDVLAQLVAGGQSAVVGAFLIASGALVLGSAIGLVSALTGGWMGSGLMRLIDAIYALPALLVAVVLAGVTGGGYFMAVALMMLLFSPYDARLVRSAALVELEKPYIDAARQIGTRRWRLLLHELWPNVRSIELANACVNFAYALVTLSALSFLGIGVPADAIDWGLMLANSVKNLTVNPYAALAPALVIIVVATSVALLGDAVQDHLNEKGRTA